MSAALVVPSAGAEVGSGVRDSSVPPQAVGTARPRAPRAGPALARARCHRLCMGSRPTARCCCTVPSSAPGCLSPVSVPCSSRVSCSEELGVHHGWGLVCLEPNNCLSSLQVVRDVSKERLKPSLGKAFEDLGPAVVKNIANGEPNESCHLQLTSSFPGKKN